MIATGGVPATENCPGAESVASTWDVLVGDAKPGGDVLLFRRPRAGARAAGFRVAGRVRQPVRDRDARAHARRRCLRPQPYSYPYAYPYARAFAARWRARYDQHAAARRPARQRLVATIGSDFAGQAPSARSTRSSSSTARGPADELYFALRSLSRNSGEVDQRALIDGRQQTIEMAASSSFRIGDAVASRNIHAAVYDGLRSAKDF